MNIEKIFRVIFLGVVFVFVLSLFSVEVRDSDLWWHLKTGEYISQTGSIPQADPFAYTSVTKDPVNPASKRIKFILAQYWLAQVIFYWIYNLFGLQGIIFLRASILAALILLIYMSVRKEGIGPYLSVGLLIPAVIIFSSNFTGERPQLFSFLLAFLLIFLLERFRKKSVGGGERPQETIFRRFGSLIPIPLVMLLWANLHGGFLVGIVVLLGYLFSETVKFATKRFGTPLPGRALKYLAGTSILSIFCAFLNPNGFNVISIMMELEKSRYMGTIIEAMSPFKIGLHYADVFMFFLVLGVGLLIMLVNLRKLDLTDAVIFSGLAIMGLSAVRFIPFFTPFAVLMVGRYGSGTMERIPGREKFSPLKPVIGMIFGVLLSGTLVFAAVKYDLFPKSGVRPDKYPAGAVKFLKEHRVPGHMFNPYYWGGYLIWKLYPEYKVFIDGRGLIEDVYFQYLSVFEARSQGFENLPDWKAVLDAYDVNFIVTFSVDKFTGRLVPLIPALYRDPDWHLIYMDKISLIFIRGGHGNQQLIDAYGLPKEWLWSEVVTEALTKAKESPQRFNFFITIGDAFFEKKSYRDAEAAYLRASRINPANGLANERLQMLRAYGY